MNINKLKHKAKTLQPVIRIGKNGLNENVHKEIKKLLKKRKLIKIKILNNCPVDKNSLIEEILKKSKSNLISRIGNIFSIHRN